MTKEEIHEGEIGHTISCWKSNDSEYLCDTQLKESDLKKYNLNEGDTVQYTIGKHGYASIVNKVKVTKKIIPLNTKN